MCDRRHRLVLSASLLAYCGWLPAVPAHTRATWPDKCAHGYAHQSAYGRPTPTITPTPEAPRSRNPDTFIYLTGREPDTLDPHVDYTTAGAGVLHNIYETLVTYDKSNPAQFVPLLAEFVPEAVPPPTMAV